LQFKPLEVYWTPDVDKLELYAKWCPETQELCQTLHTCQLSDCNVSVQCKQKQEETYKDLYKP
jgi:hypothetical protein